MPIARKASNISGLKTTEIDEWKKAHQVFAEFPFEQELEDSDFHPAILEKYKPTTIYCWFRNAMRDAGILEKKDPRLTLLRQLADQYHTLLHCRFHIHHQGLDARVGNASTLSTRNNAQSKSVKSSRPSAFSPKHNALQQTPHQVVWTTKNSYECSHPKNLPRRILKILTTNAGTTRVSTWNKSSMVISLHRPGWRAAARQSGCVQGPLSRLFRLPGGGSVPRPRAPAGETGLGCAESPGGCQTVSC